MSDEGTAREAVHDECYACPIGGLFLAARAARPEAVDHVLNAVSELVLAARAVLDAAERVLDEQRGGRPRDGGESRLSRIDIG